LVAKVLAVIDDRRPLHVSLVGGDPLVRYRELEVLLPQIESRGVHDERRKPATYERILKNIAGTKVTIHCTITSQIAARPGYLDEFLEFWSGRPEIAKVWFSIFTPQIGATDAEILTSVQRTAVIADLRQLRVKYLVLDMPDSVINELATSVPVWGES
jgi:hypothetical protein